MTDVAFKLIAYMFVFNIASGIMALALPAIYSPEYQNNLHYDPNMSQTFTTDINKAIKPSGDLENAGDESYRILDLTVVGMIQRSLSTLINFPYSFIKILDNLLGGYIAEDNPELWRFLFNPLSLTSIPGVLYIMVSFAYAYGVVKMWTSKSLFGEN